MDFQLSTVGKVSKGLTVKLEKVSKDEERVIATLKITDAIIQRHEIDQLFGRPVGWITKAFFDELGSPVGRFAVALDREWSVFGVIRGTDDSQVIKLANCVMSDAEVAVITNGGVLSCTLQWPVAGDEASDAEMLLGKACALVWSIGDGGQLDLLKPAA